MPKKRRRPKNKAFRATPGRFVAGLNQVESLMERGHWMEAREMLEALDQRFPNQPEVLSLLANVNLELVDPEAHQAACERLLKIIPRDPATLQALAGSYLINERPALALRTFRRFLDLYPDDEDAEEMHAMVIEVEAELKAFWASVGVTDEEGFDLGVLHEEAQSFMAQGKFKQARECAEQLIKRRPDFVPALNNLSQIHQLEGNSEQAIAAARRVLELDANNYHALSNLTRYLLLNGSLEEAKELSERLKAIKSETIEAWIKKAEALSYLGDDEGVLDAFKGAERLGLLTPPEGEPLLFHLAAVAAMRLGREDEARRHWQQALSLSPGFDPAAENLDDLSNPPSERHAPWSYSIGGWLPQKTTTDLITHLKQSSRRRGDEEKNLADAARSYLQQHPEVGTLVPLLLDRGDGAAREFALRLALAARTPELLSALRDFALGQRGPDAMRHQAAQAATEAGLLLSGEPTRLWMGGEWRELLLFGWEIHEEAEQREHAPKVEKWMAEAIYTLRDGDAKKAERLLKQALEVEPDSPDILNNLAAAYMVQERTQEAEELFQQVHQHHPDYMFARIGLAHLLIKRGQLDEAEALLKPLLTRKHFHVGEMIAFLNAQIELYVAQGNTDAARSWLDMWINLAPEHPAISVWKRRLGKGSWRERLLGRHA